MQSVVILKIIGNFGLQLCKWDCAVISHYTSFLTKTKRCKRLETIGRRTKGALGLNAEECGGLGNKRSGKDSVLAYFEKVSITVFLIVKPIDTNQHLDI